MKKILHIYAALVSLLMQGPVFYSSYNKIIIKIKKQFSDDLIDSHALGGAENNCN